VMLYKIAHLRGKICLPEDGRRFDKPGKVSNPDQIFGGGSAIITVEMSTSSLSFRFSELSQAI
jgi:hypothetical protein